MVRLDAIAQVDRGKFAHRPRNDPRFYGGSIPFVQTGDVSACNSGYLRSFMQTLNDDGLKISRVFPLGTLMVTIAANICDTAIATFDVAFPDSLVGIIPGPLVRAEYLQLALQKVKAKLKHGAPETAQKNINLDTLRHYVSLCHPFQSKTRCV